MAQLKNAPAKTGTSPADQLMISFKNDVQSIVPYLEKLLPNKAAVGRFIWMANLAVMREPKLFTCTKKSLLLSLLFCAQKNLEPGVEDGCWILPFKVKGVLTATPIPGYKGIIKRAVEVGAVLDINPQPVYEHDEFYYELGLEEKLTHIPPKLGEDRGDLIGAYVVITLPNNQKKFKVMDRPSIEKIRNSGAAWRNNPDSGPWKDWEEAMFLKTVIKQGLKTVPAKEALRDLLADDSALDAGKGVAALLTEAGEELPEDLQGEEEPAGGETGTETKKQTHSAFDLLVDKKLEGLEPAAAALRREHLKENLKISAKNMNKTVPHFKEFAANFFEPYVNDKQEQKKGFWQSFLDWETKNYPAAAPAAATESPEAGPGEGAEENPAPETAKSPEASEEAVPIFADRRRNVVTKILSPPIPLADLGLRSLEEITPDNIEEIEGKVQAWKPPKKK